MAAKFYIQSEATKLVMTVHNDNPGPGAQITMQPYQNRPSQLFTFVNDSIFTVLSPSFVLDIEGKKGPNVITFPCSSKASQQWKFNDDGTIGNLKDKVVLDVNGGSTAPGANVIVWKKGDKAANQMFSRVFV